MISKVNNFPSFRSAFSDTAIITFINAALGMVTAIFLARYLGPSSRGDLAIIIASITILSSLTDIYQGGNEITLGKNRELLPKILMITLIGSIVFSSLFFIIVSNSSISNFFLSSDNLRIKIISCIFFLQIILYDGFKRILNAKQEFFFINRIDIFHSILYLAFLVLSILLIDIKVFGVLVVLCVANGARLLFVFKKLYSYLKNLKQNSRKLDDDTWYIDFFNIGKRNFLWSMPYALIQRMSIWQIAAYSTSENVGIYRVATTITEVVLMIPRAANTITRGKAVSEDGGWIRSLYTSKIVCVFGIICTIIFSATGWFLVPLIFGNEYLMVYKLGIMLLLSVSFLGSVFVLEAQIVSKMKFPKTVIIINYICLLILFLLNLILIPVYGILSAGLAFLLTSFSLFLMYNLAFAKFSSIKKRDIFFINTDEKELTKEIFRTYKKNYSLNQDYEKN